MTFKKGFNLNVKIYPFWACCDLRATTWRDFSPSDLVPSVIAARLKWHCNLGGVVKDKEELVEQPFAIDCLMVSLFHEVTNLFATCICHLKLYSDIIKVKRTFC